MRNNAADPSGAAVAALANAVQQAREAGVRDFFGGELDLAMEAEVALRKHASSLLEEARRARRGRGGRRAARAA